jgi:hypothetical protein
VKGISTSLHRTVPHPWEVWNCGLQAGPATILSCSSWHLPRVATEEMFEGTCGRRVAISDTVRGLTCTPSTQSRSWIRRIVLRGVKQSIEDTMEQSLWRRSNLGKWGFSPFSPSRFWATIERERAFVRCPFRTFSPFKSQDEILF